MDIDPDPVAATAAPANSARAKRTYKRRVAPRAAAKAAPVERAAPPVITRSPIRNTDVRERKRKGDSSTDIFAIPKELIPDGLSLEWKRETAAGMDDPHYMVSLYEQGWRPVDASLIPQLMPVGYTGPIRMKGQLLMERPIELTREAEAENYQNARRAVDAKERQLHGITKGALSEGGRSAQSGVVISKSYQTGIPVGA